MDPNQNEYFAVIFTVLTTSDLEGYEQMGERMLELAMKQDGFIGIEFAGGSGSEITVSYWKDEESIKNWKQVADHLIAQEHGKRQWYKNYTIRVCKVVRDYTFNRDI